MSSFSRRIASAFIATAVIGSMAIGDAAFAQAPTIGPAGGVATTTAPSNSQGTPAGGTGVISTTRVGPAGVSPAPAPMTGPAADPAPVARRRVRRHRRPAHRPAAARPASEIGTQSQAGTNGSVPPAAR